MFCTLLTCLCGDEDAKNGLFTHFEVIVLSQSSEAISGLPPQLKIKLKLHSDLARRGKKKVDYTEIYAAVQT